MQMAIWLLEIFSVSLVIREMQTQTVVRHHFPPIRMAIIFFLNKENKC